MMFIFLPLFAWFLKLFYKRRKFFYVDHAIFSLHFHSAVFLHFLATTLLEKIIPGVAWPLFWIELALVYTYGAIALRNAYGQSRGLSFAKALALGILYQLIIIVGYIVAAMAYLF
jgi:hypothetical protein